MDPMDSAWDFLKSEAAPVDSGGGLGFGVTADGFQPIFNIGTRRQTDYPKIAEEYSPEAAQRARNVERVMQLMGLGLSANTALEALADPSNATSSQVLGRAGTGAYTTYSTIDQLTPNFVNRALAGQETREEREKREAMEEFMRRAQGAGSRRLGMGTLADPTPEEPTAPSDSSHLFNFAEDAEFTEGPEDASVPLLTGPTGTAQSVRVINPDDAYPELMDDREVFGP